MTNGDQSNPGNQVQSNHMVQSRKIGQEIRLGDFVDKIDQDIRTPW
jgi:hypothetical protein